MYPNDSNPYNDQTTPIYPNPYPSTPPSPPAKRGWWKRRSLGAKIGIIACLILGSLFTCGLIANATKGPDQKTARVSTPTATHQTASTIAPTSTIYMMPTATPTVAPTPTPEPPTPTPAPVEPTQPPIQIVPTPTPVPIVTCNGTMIDGGCYNTDPNGGTVVYNTPAGFCSIYVCISNFPNGTGYIVECADTHWSHSGGISGACSRNGGVIATLYKH